MAKVLWKCPACGLKARVPATTPRVFCACGFVQRNGVRAGLGDYVAAGLHRVGITKDRVSRVLGRPCGCLKRQMQLNRLGRKVGIG